DVEDTLLLAREAIAQLPGHRNRDFIGTWKCMNQLCQRIGQRCRMAPQGKPLSTTVHLSCAEDCRLEVGAADIKSKDCTCHDAASGIMIGHRVPTGTGSLGSSGGGPVSAGFVHDAGVIGPSVAGTGAGPGVFEC